MAGAAAGTHATQLIAAPHPAGSPAAATASSAAAATTTTTAPLDGDTLSAAAVLAEELLLEVKKVRPRPAPHYATLQCQLKPAVRAHRRRCSARAQDGAARLAGCPAAAAAARSA